MYKRQDENGGRRSSIHRGRVSGIFSGDRKKCSERINRTLSGATAAVKACPKAYACTPRAVSYTHLDVYKRQQYDRYINLLNEFEALFGKDRDVRLFSAPDVYKRQRQ